MKAVLLITLLILSCVKIVLPYKTQKCQPQSTETLRVLTPSILYGCVKQQSLLLYQKSNENSDLPARVELTFKQGINTFIIIHDIPEELANQNSFKYYFNHTISATEQGMGFLKYALVTKDDREIVQVNTTLAKMVVLDDWIIFETSKPIYKQDDVIKGRIFVESGTKFQGISQEDYPGCLNLKMNPSSHNITVMLVNAYNQVLANWYHRNASEYLNIEYPITEDNRLGIWKFKILYKNKTISKNITVVRYKSTGVSSKVEFDSLPSFIGSSEYSINDWNVTVCGRLTSGELATVKPSVAYCICKDLARSGVKLSRNQLLFCEKPDYFTEEQKNCFYKQLNNTKGCGSFSYSVENWRNKDSKLGGYLSVKYRFMGPFATYDVEKTKRLKEYTEFDHFVKSYAYLDPIFPTQVKIQWPIRSLNGTFVVSLENRSGTKLKSLLNITEENMTIMLPPSLEVMNFIVYKISENNLWMPINSVPIMTKNQPQKSKHRIQMMNDQSDTFCKNNSKTYLLISNEDIEEKTLRIMSQERGQLYNQQISLEPYILNINNDSIINSNELCNNSQCSCQENQCARMLEEGCRCTDFDSPTFLESLYFYKFSIYNVTALKPSFNGILYYINDDLQFITAPFVINSQEISSCSDQTDAIRISLSKSIIHPGSYVNLDVSLNENNFSFDQVDECFVNIYDKEMIKMNQYDYPLHIFDEKAYLDMLSKIYPVRKYVASLDTNPLEQTNMYIMNSCSHKENAERRSQLLYYPFEGAKEILHRYLFTEKREYFPDSLLFTHLKIFNESFSIPIKVPEVLTTWKLSAYCRTKRGALIRPTGSNQSLVVSQAYKIVTSIPDELAIDEEVSVPVKIVQYDRELNKNNNTFELLYSQTAYSNSNNLTMTHVKPMLISSLSDGWNETRFSVSMEMPGTYKVNLAAKLQSVSCNCIMNTTDNQYSQDIVETNVKVSSIYPEEERSITFFACLDDDGKFSTIKLLDLPTNLIVNNSFTYSIEVAKSPINFFKNNINVLEKLPLTPLEKHIIFTVSQMQHILTLWKIKQPKQHEASLMYRKKEREHLENLRQSYFKISDYIHSEGYMYMWSGTSGFKSSAWLTAVVAKVYLNLLDKIGIAKLGFNPCNIIQKNLQFLMSKFSKDICFEMDEYKFWNALPSEEENRYLFNLFLLQTLYKVKIGQVCYEDQENIVKLQSMISNAVECVKKNQPVMNTSNLLYAQFIYWKSLESKYKKLPVEEQSDMWTEVNDSIVMDEKNEEMYFKNEASDHAVNIQYNLLAYLSLHERLSEVEKARFIKWLLNQRDYTGGFKSMINTLLVLDVLPTYYSSFDKPVSVEFSEKQFSPEINGTITPDIFSFSHSYVNENRGIAPRKPMNIALKLSGHKEDANRCMSVQLKTSYNIRKSFKKPSVKLMTVKSFTADKINYLLSICLKNYNKLRILKIKIPTGFEVKLEDFFAPTAYEENTGTIKTIYFYDYGSPNNCLKLPFDRKFDVCNIRPGYIRLYDAYSYYIRRGVEDFPIFVEDGPSCGRRF